MTAPRREGMSAELRYWKDRADERALRVIELQEEIKQALAIVEAAGETEKALAEAVAHSCEVEGADFGYHTCCGQRDYLGHKETCYLTKALSAFRKAADDGVKP